MDLTPIDRILLRAHEIKQVLDGHGLHNARVVGWAGAGHEGVPGVPAEIQVDLPEVTDLTSGDLARLDREISAMVGVEVVVWAERPGEARVLSGERIHYL
ncbi:hypothetical protein [Enemella sp. A6]|uniref:hypothetical protein n=1 Tax=Enemella sp. A6 TaxID=3440152 RepID=UPI003EB978BF